ncbi:hypothetical protein OAU13_00320 [bacterium]|nr:hypothetical protein [bacterium]
MIKKKIWVTFQKEGIHCYPAAATDPKLKDVAFLGNPHRHMFHFKVSLEVFHDDRDVEFILLKRELEGLYGRGTLKLDYMSCEMIAEELLTYMESQYPGRDVTINVSEDNENGCELVYERFKPALSIEDTRVAGL